MILFYIRQLKDTKIKPIVEVFTPSVMLLRRHQLFPRQHGRILKFPCRELESAALNSGWI